MHKLKVTLLLLLRASSCIADFVDPTDLFNFDETNVQISKPREDDEKDTSVTVGQGDGDAHGQLPQAAPPISNDPSRKGLSLSDGEEQKGTASRASSDIQGNCKEDRMDRSAMILFQQLAMQVVHHSRNMDEDLSHPTEFCLRIKASHHDLEILQKFGEGDSASLHAAHDRLSNVIQRASPVPADGPVLWLEHKLGLSRTVLCLVVTALLIIYFIFKVLLSVRLTSSKVWFVILAVFVTSVALTWLEMYQKKVADRERLLRESIAIQCPQYDQLSVWERFTFYVSSSLTFQDENCREYFEALFVDPAAQVSPLEAIAVATVKTLVSPLKIIGEGIKGFIVGLFKDLPLQFQTFLLTIVSVLVILIPFMAFGYRIRVPLLLSIEPIPQPRALPAQQVIVRQSIRQQGGGDALPHSESMELELKTRPQQQVQLSRRELPPPASRATAATVKSETTMPPKVCYIKEAVKVESSQQSSHSAAKASPPSPHSMAKEVPMGRHEESADAAMVKASKLVGAVQDSQPMKGKTELDGSPHQLEEENFVDLMHCDCEESYVDLDPSDFNNFSHIEAQDLKREDVSVENSHHSEESGVISCPTNEENEDLTDLRVRDT